MVHSLRGDVIKRGTLTGFVGDQEEVAEAAMQYFVIHA
jgi:hypothetical protein